MSDVVAAAALGTSLFGLAVMARQLRVAREPLARGLVIGARPATGTVVHRGKVEQPREFEFTVRAVGPGTYFDVVGAVVDGSNERHTVIDSVPRLTNELGDVTGTRSMTSSEARSAMFVVTWITGHRDGIRTNAYRIGVLAAPGVAGTGADGGTVASRTKRAGRAAECLDRGQRPRDSEHADRTIEVFQWDRTWRTRNRAWMRIRRWIPASIRHAAPERFVDRFQASGRWRRLPPSVPVRGIWPARREAGRWY